MSKIKMNHAQMTMREVYNLWLTSCKTRGAASATIKTYQEHLNSLGKYFDVTKPFSAITQETIDSLVADMRDSQALSDSSISSYTRTLRTFFNWCNSGSYVTGVKVVQYKAQETVKETYTDEELRTLLKTPNTKKCSFCEYRNWVAINFLMNSGCRAGTLVSIQLRDIDFDNNLVYCRHTKSKKVLVLPLCREMTSIIKEYLAFRQGAGENYLFCNEQGSQLTTRALEKSVANYNRARGVEKTSLHLFRHTYAKKYLLDCQGDIFTLQKILGHSTLEMTKHYCNIYDADIQKNYEQRCPLNLLVRQGRKIQIN